MSNFFSETKHPETGEWVKAEWLDDYYGRRRYGVRFPDGKVFPESECQRQYHTTPLACSSCGSTNSESVDDGVSTFRRCKGCGHEGRKTRYVPDYQANQEFQERMQKAMQKAAEHPTF